MNTDALERQRIRKLLVGKPPAVIGEAYAIIQRQIAGEDARFSQLAAKANGLQGTVGLSMTVIGGVVGIVVTTKASTSVLAYGALIIAVICGFVSAASAHRAQLVATYKGLRPSDVLKEDILDFAALQPDSHKLSAYQHALLPDLYEIWKRASSVNGEKANLIKKAQWAYMFFLGFLFVSLAAAAFTAVA